MTKTINTIQDFGVLPDGQVVKSIKIACGPLRAEVLTYGAIIRDLRFENHQPPLVLGLNTIEDYLIHSRNFGSTIGRCANRIAHGCFTIAGIEYHLERNEALGVNHIHGGSHGIGRSLWSLCDVQENSVILAITDPANNAGYPGSAKIICKITLTKNGVLSIHYESQCDLPCPINICHHGYFNLGENDTIYDHKIKIAADFYLPVDDNKIPIGVVKSVENTPFDLRKETHIGERLKQVIGGFDHNFCLSKQKTALRPVALVHAPNGLHMEVATTEPGVQFFTAPTLDCKVAGLDGRYYGKAAGFCLETQIWPDAINQKHFPNIILHPHEVRLQKTEYRFFHQ